MYSGSKICILLLFSMSTAILLTEVTKPQLVLKMIHALVYLLVSYYG